MKNIIKKLLPCLLVICSVFVISSCTKKDKYKYPSQVPNLNATFAGETFAKVGDLSITNGDVYYRLLNSYGLNTLQRIVDKTLLTFDLNEKQEKQFQDHLNSLIYGTTDLSELTDEEKAEKLEDFKTSALSDGLIIDESKKADDLYYENYYLLDFKRLVKTIEVLKTEIVEFNEKADEYAEKNDTDPEYFFKDADYLNYFTSNFHKTQDLIIITFDSEKQAKDTLNAAGVDTTKLEGPWVSKTDGTALTKDAILNTFINVYKATYGEDITGATTYTHKELLKISNTSSNDTTIANKAVALKADDLDKSYTHGPLTYGGRYYMVLKTGESTKYYNDSDNTITYDDVEANIVEKDDFNKVTKISEDLKTKIYDEVVLAHISKSSKTYENTIARVMFELRQKANLQIFSEGLEISYKNAFNTTYNSLSIKDYEAFKETTEESNSVVFKWDGHEITTEQMFDALSDRYSALIVLLFVQQYTILNSKHNTIVDYITGTIKNQGEYDKYVKSDLNSYKEAFEQDKFAPNGYPATYGWENFLRDYIGLEVEADAITDFNGTLYNDVLALYTKAIYTATVDDVEIKAVDVEGTKKWFLSSPKWQNSYDTGVTVINEATTPEVLLVYKADEFKNSTDKELVKNDYYGHFVVRSKDASGNTVDTLTNITTDQAVLEKYKTIFDETFNATVSGIYAYYDKDLDGKADEIEADSEQANLAKALTNLVWTKVGEKDQTNTLYTNINDVIREYATSSKGSEWDTYKLAGLRLTAIQGSTFSNTSDAEENLLTYVSNMWKDIVDYKNLKNDKDETIGTTITGQSLDPGYRYVKNDKAYFVTATQFSNKYDSVVVENGAYKLAVTKATARVNEYYYTTSGGVEKNIQKVSLYFYEQSLLKKDDREVTVNCTAQINAYYKPAINQLSKEKIVNLTLMNDCKALLSDVSFTENNEYFHKVLTALIDAAIENNTETDK